MSKKLVDTHELEEFEDEQYSQIHKDSIDRKINKKPKSWNRTEKTTKTNKPIRASDFC
jgi:hypothetical protein